MATQNASLGSIGVSPSLISLPRLPAIGSEWAALLPLVIHLASYQDDYHTAGDISLLKRLPIGLFPALGTFSSIARLLERGSEYLDCASTKGLSNRKVWDVNWGSTFPVANGAASASINSYLMKTKRPCVTRLYTLINSNAPSSTHKVAGPIKATSIDDSSSSCSSSSSSSASASAKSANKSANKMNSQKISRPQILNVYKFNRTVAQQHKRAPLRQVLNRFRRSRLFQLLLACSLILLSVFFGIFGAFGTAAITLLCALSEIVSQLITIQRPLSYLQNNEEHDACMLVAAHANAMEWDLYTGDRAIVDTLLNKPMIVLPEPKKVRWGARWFRYANIIQLAAMTFVTAQKGWDGVCLVFLIIIHYALSRLFSGDALVSDWLDREHVDVTIKRFEFSGRNRMIGAIQVFSGTKIDRWMDEILVPHPRRDFWLDILKLPKGQAVKYPDDFTEHDKERVEGDAAAAHEAANILKRDMSTSNDGSDHSPPGTP